MLRAFSPPAPGEFRVPELTGLPIVPAMSHPSDLPPEWAARFERTRSAVAAWYDWLKEPHLAQTSSALYEDDRIHEKRPVRDASWQGLISATDNLGLMVDSMEAIGNRPVAHFTLARASLFAAARTVWVLHPSDRHIRQERALWVAYEDMRNLITLVRESRRNPADPNALAALAHVDAQMNELKDLARTALGTSDTDIVNDAAAYLDPADGDLSHSTKMLWRINSGHAHGLSWPNVLRRPTDAFVGPDGRTYQSQTANAMDIVQAASAAMLMTNQAFTLYDDRATHP
jgi:hypothetical protein